MTFMIKTLANCLGNPASAMLADAPFKNWPLKKSFRDDLEEPIIHYVFPQNGLELRCDLDDKISVIFLYSDEFRGFYEGLLDLPFSFTRLQVVERLGPPSQSGSRINDPILAAYGSWHPFARPAYPIHVEYGVDADRTTTITLMRAAR